MPELRGSHMDDPFLSKIKGYTRRQEVTRDAMQLHNEVDGIWHTLFPVMEKPAGRPGYVVYERDYFALDHDDQEIQHNLEEYFLGKYSRFKDNIYSNAHDLAGFLEFLGYGLLIDGKVFYALDWGKMDFNGASYILPRGLQCLRTSTVKIRRRLGRIVGFKQRYSVVTRTREKYYHLKNRDFGVDEVLFLKYPFERRSPVERSLKYLPQIKKFWDFGLNQSRASSEPTDYSMQIEKARHTSYTQEKRKHDLIRAKIRGQFNYLIDNLRLTEYYDLYTVMKYKRFLNNFRSYLLDEFNKQVLGRIAKKNHWQTSPVIQVKNGIFLGNETIDNCFRKYAAGEIDIDTFIDRVIKVDKK